MRKENAKAEIGRFGCAFPPAFGTVEAPFGAGFMSGPIVEKGLTGAKFLA
jgi:hypothetical protein